MPLPNQKNESFLFNAFYVFVVRFFPAFANLLVVLYYSRAIDKACYGTYQNFWIQLNFLYPLLCLGLQSLILTYTPGTIVSLSRRITAGHIAKYAVWSVSISVCFACLQASNGWPFAALAALFIWVFSANMVAESVLVLFRRYRLLSAINLVYSVSWLGFHYLAIVKGFNLQYLFIVLLTINVVKLAILAFVGRKAMHSAPVVGVETGTRTMADIRKLWWHMGFNDVLQAFSTWIDKFIVSVMLTAALSAVYYNGAQNIPFLSLVLSAAGSSVLLQLASASHGNEKQVLMQAMKQAGRYSSSLVLPLFVFLVTFRHELFNLLLPGYELSVPVFLVSLLILPIRSYSFFTVFQKLHLGHIGNKGALLELVIACLLMYPMYHLLGLPGVALCFVISTYAQVAYYLVHMQRIFSAPWYSVLPVVNWAIKAAISLLVFFVAHWLLRAALLKTCILAGLLILLIIVAVSFWLEYRNALKYGRK